MDCPACGTVLFKRAPKRVRACTTCGARVCAHGGALALEETVAREAYALIAAGEMEIAEARRALPADASPLDVAWRILNRRMGEVRSFAEEVKVHDAREAFRRWEQGGKVTEVPGGDAYLAKVNQAKWESFEVAGEAVRGIRYVALLDASTHPLCRRVHGRTMRRSSPYWRKVAPPFVRGCACTIVPVLEDEEVRWDDDWGEWLERHNVEAAEPSTETF